MYNFINPIRRPQSSLYIPNNQPQLINNNNVKPRINILPNNYQDNSRNLEFIKKEKHNLEETLKEKENLEIRIIEETEKAIKNQHQRELDSVQNQILRLKTQLDEKSKLEKYIQKKQENFLREQEERTLNKIRAGKFELMDRITQQEKNITKIKEEEELRNLKKEKESLARQFKEMEVSEIYRREKEITQAEIDIKKEREQAEIQNLEVLKIKQETENLRNLIDHKNNQEKWLSNRLKIDNKRETTNRKIKELNDAVQENKEKLSSKNKAPTYHFKPNRFFNDVNDGYESDNEAIPGTESVLNSSIFESKRETTRKSNLLDLDKIELNDIQQSKSNNKKLNYNDIVNQLELDLKENKVSGRDAEKMRLILKACNAMKPQFVENNDDTDDDDAIPSNLLKEQGKAQLPRNTDIDNEADPAITTLHSEIFDIKEMMKEKKLED